MSRHEGKGGHQPEKWAWARHKGLGLTAAGVLAAGAFAYGRWHRGADGLTSFERLSLRLAGGRFDGAPSNGSGSKPQTVNLAELGRPMPPDGKVVVAAVGMRSLTELVSRGGQAAIGYRESDGAWLTVAEDPERPFADLGENALGFHEIGAALHVSPTATELAIGSRVIAGSDRVFYPLTTLFRDDGEAWTIAEKHPEVPIMRISPPGSGS